MRAEASVPLRVVPLKQRRLISSLTMDQIHPSPPPLRTLQPAALHSFHQQQQQQQDERGAATAYAVATAASAAYNINSADSSLLFQPSLLPGSLPDRAGRASQDPLPQALAGLQHSSISASNPTPGIFHFAPPQHQRFAAAASTQQDALRRVKTHDPAPVSVVQDAESAVKLDGKIDGLKIIPDPPGLNQWRDRLFHADETIVMTEDQYVPRTSSLSALP